MCIRDRQRGSENFTWKETVAQTWSFCDYFFILAFYILDNECYKWIRAPLKWISWMKDLLLCVHVVVKNFTLKLGRLRQRILLKCVSYVQHDCFSSFNQSHHCFLVQSLPVASRRRCLNFLTISLVKWRHIIVLHAWLARSFDFHDVLCRPKTWNNKRFIRQNGHATTINILFSNFLPKTVFDAIV